MVDRQLRPLGRSARQLVRVWFWKIAQQLAHGGEQIGSIAQDDGVDLGVVQLGVAVRQDVAEADDVAGIGDAPGDGGCELVELAKGLSADFQGAFDSGPGFLVIEIAFQAVASTNRVAAAA